MMKKSAFTVMILGTVSGMMFALGMCMALIPEWDMFKPGIAVGVVGAVLALVTVIVYRRMEGLAPLHPSMRIVQGIGIGVAGGLLLGVGMCLTMVWGRMVLGIVVGCVGIVVLLMLVPFTKGLKD